MWWLATALSGTRASWTELDRGWRSEFARLDDEVAFEPARRYAARHASGRVTLPLVVPTELAADDALSGSC